MSVYIRFPGTDAPLSDSVGFQIGGQMHYLVEGVNPDTWHRVSATKPTGGQNEFLLVFDASMAPLQVQFADLRLEIFDEEPLTHLAAVPLRQGVSLWRDAPYTLDRVPANLLGADLFQLPVRTWGSFTVEVRSGSAVHLLFAPGRDAGLEAFLRSDAEWCVECRASTAGALGWQHSTSSGVLAIATRQVVPPATFDFPAVASERIVSVVITGNSNTSASTVANRVILQDSCRPTDLFSPERIVYSVPSDCASPPRPAAALCWQTAAILALLLALPR